MPKLSHGMFEVFRRLDGAKFNGHLTSSSLSSSKDKAPYRIMLVRRPTFVLAGDTVFSKGGEVVILMDHPDDHSWAASYKAVYALDVLNWSRQTTTIDPVSGVPKDTGYSAMGSLYVNFDSPELMNFEGFQDTKYRFITGQDVRVDDKVGTYIVKRVVKSLGVKIVYAA